MIDMSFSSSSFASFMQTGRVEKGQELKEEKHTKVVKRKVIEETIVIDGDDADKENLNDDSRKYKWLLKAQYRKQFMSKFGPIIQARGNGVKLGGQNRECWLISGYQAKDKGGPRASYQVYLNGRDNRVTVSGAKAAVIFRLIQEAKENGDTGDIQWPYPDNFEASHLCHSSNCLRPSHIVMESRSVNDERNNCSGEIECPVCETVLAACTHDPPCIWKVEATRCSSCYGSAHRDKKQCSIAP
jgi:hypothetical protein